MRFVRSHRSNYGARRSNVSPWLIIGICAAVAVVVTVVVGNLLKIWLDDEALRHLKEGDPSTDLEEPIYKAPVSDVHAFSYVFGDHLDGVALSPEVSLSLNTPAGEMNYTSPVGTYFHQTLYRDPPLADSMGELRSVSTYISGVFYPQAFLAESADLRYAQTMIEVSLIREFLQAGGSDILLCDLPFDSAGESAVLSYLTSVKRAAGASPVGVAVPWERMNREDGGAFLERLLTVCDFIALDLRGQNVPISDLSYHLSQYDMRLLYLSDQTEQIDAARQTVSSLQTVTKPPQKAEPEEPPETE